MIDRRHHQNRCERASILMLMPAAVLIVVILGSIALDFGTVHLRQRELDNIAAAAANDAVGFGVSEADLRSGDGDVALRPDLVEAALRDALARRGLDGVELAGFCIDPISRRGVRVALRLNTRYFMARAIPGASSSITLTSIQSASLESDRYASADTTCSLGLP